MVREQESDPSATKLCCSCWLNHNLSIYRNTQYSCFEIPQMCLTLLCVSGRALAGRQASRTGCELVRWIQGIVWTWKSYENLMRNFPKASKLCIWTTHWLDLTRYINITRMAKLMETLVPFCKFLKRYFWIFQISLLFTWGSNSSETPGWD